jgi:hypothetical protein
MFELFVKGGVPYMTLLTLIFIALFLAAWKAPAWVKEVGLFALVFGIFSFLVGMSVGAEAISKAADVVPQHIIWGGFRIATIAPVYGLIIYMVSLIIRIIQKPRI